jgi:RHS repeat-associated protein
VARCPDGTGTAGEREINDGSQLVFARTGSWTVTDEYGFYPGGDQPMSLQLPSGRTGVFITDPQLRGTVRAIADADKNATNVEFKTYDISPWGEVAADTGSITRLRMAGQQYDQGSELYYMRARYYDPQLGRFLSEDPIGISGGLNLYAYAGNDPVNKADPSGLGPGDPFVWCELAEKTFDYAYWESVDGQPRRVYHYTQYFDCHVVGGPQKPTPTGAWTRNPNPLPHSSDEPPAPKCTLQKVRVFAGGTLDAGQILLSLEGITEVARGASMFGRGVLASNGGVVALEAEGGLSGVRMALNASRAQAQVTVGALRMAGGLSMLATADATRTLVRLPDAGSAPPTSWRDFSFYAMAREELKTCQNGG